MKFKIVSLSAQYEPYMNRKNEPYKAANKLYISPSGESLLEHLFNRHDRPSALWRKEVIPVLIEQLKYVNKEAYKTVKEQKWGWRQNCGCSTCGCSPGFVSHGTGQYTISADIMFES